ncbi:retrovirus-related pol polyprotein from transposon TNT 1-94 [Tanacetum coccineum]
MTGDRSQLTNFVNKFLGTVKFGNDHVAKILGYGDYQIGNVTISRVYYVEGLGHNLFSVGQFCDSNLEVAFRQHTCFIRKLDGVDLLTGSQGNNLYTLSLGDIMASAPICLLSKASKTKSWLRHRRLSHLNFGAINHLVRHGLVRGLPKLKFEKEYLCSAYAMGKSKKKPHKPKSKDTNQDKLYLLHMDLCGSMSKDEAPDFIIKFLKMIQMRLKVPVRRTRTDNETEFVNQTLCDYYEKVGISYETFVARSPQQNGVVKRRNRMLIEAARTMLIYEKALLFLWAEAVATACYTQNHSIIRLRHGKTPYELLHDKLPDLSFFHVFGALCYPINNSENLGKLQPKADIGIFIGYAPTKKAFQIYNRHTRRIIKTIHVDFDKLTAMASEHSSSGPALHEMTPATISLGLVPNPPPSTANVPTLQELIGILFSKPLFDELLNPPSSVDRPAPEVIAPIAEVVAPEPAASTGSPSSTTVDQDAPSPSNSQTTPKTQSPVIPNDVEEDNHDLDVAHMNNDPFFGIPIPENDSEASSSSDVIPTIVHTAAPNSEHVTKWTKDHPLDNIIGELERLVSTRLQLHEQALFCYYDAFLTSVEPKNYKDALTQACWIEAMQEELNEFEHLKVWELVPRPDKVMVSEDSEPVESSAGKPDNDDINLKFLRALPSSWSQVALALKTRAAAACYPTHSAFIGAASSMAQSFNYTNQQIMRQKTRLMRLQRYMENGSDFHADTGGANVSAVAASLAYQNAVKTLESQKDWYHKTQIALEDKIRVLSANLENTANTLRTKIGLGFKEYFGKDEVFDLSTPSVMYPEPVEEVKPLYSWFVKAGEMHAVPPSITGTYMPTPYNDKSSDSETYASCDSSLKTKTKDFPPAVDIKTLPESDVEDPNSTAWQDLVVFLFGESASKKQNQAVNSAGRPNPAVWSKKDQQLFSAVDQFLLVWLNPAARPYFRPSSVIPVQIMNICIVDSGSQEYDRNKEKLDDFCQVQGSIVKFGGGDGRISGKGIIRTSNLDFENVYYVEELQHFNLFSVSQICDKKNKVLFTDTDCLVLAEDFQLPDESQVVLRIPRERDLYTFNISELQPEQNVTCLVAKASLDESTRWHRRMAHVNFKTINKLAKEGLVDGLPLKVFTNEHNCVACNKGKQHKASYKHISAVRLITETLQLLHMDLFGPTNIRSIGPKSTTPCKLLNDFSRFTWTILCGY